MGAGTLIIPITTICYLSERPTVAVASARGVSWQRSTTGDASVSKSALGDGSDLQETMGRAPPWLEDSEGMDG